MRQLAIVGLGVRTISEWKKRWHDHISCKPVHSSIVIKDAGLVLGADTILVRMAKTRSGARALAIEADRERLTGPRKESDDQQAA